MLPGRAFVTTGVACLAACSLLVPASAQEHRAAAAFPRPFLSLERYTPDQGLSQHTITALAEDDRGLMWIGTQEGLNRYDGQHFEVLRSVPRPDAGSGRPRALASSSVESLLVDSRSRLWVGTNDAGLEVIELRSGRHHRIGSAEGLAQPTVRAILLDDGGGAWLGTASGVERVDPQLDGAHRIGASGPVLAMVRSPWNEALALDAGCRLWRLARTHIELSAAPLPSGATCVALENDAGALWLATAAHGIYRLDEQGRVTRHLPAAWLRPGTAELRALLKRRDGGWLLGYSDGVVMQSAADWSTAPVRVAFDQRIESAITRFHEHDSGVLWIGSATSGLFRVRALSPLLRRDRVDAAAMTSWPSRSVRSILVEGSRLMVGTDAGLVVQARPGAAWEIVAAIGHTSVRAITPARAGGWWIGTHHGLWRLARDGTAHAIEGLPHPQVTDLLVEENVVWVTTRGGLGRVRDGAVDNGDLPPQLTGQFLTSLMRDRRGRLWIGSNEDGIYRIEVDGRLSHLHSRSGALSHDSIWTIHEGSDAVWLGSYSGGLLRLDPGTDRARAITTAEGLSNNVVYRIEPDMDGRLWLSTNAGISVLDPGSGRIQRLGRGDGLFNREYNSGASLSGPDGLLYLGGTDGLDVIEPAMLPMLSPAAVPVITGLEVLGRQQDPSAATAATALPNVSYADQVTLDYRDRVFSLGLVAVDFTTPETTRLRYRIPGLHDGWVEPAEPQTSLMLSFLPPGRYPLEVQAAGRDGRFGDSRRLLLSINPPPWRHPLAYAGYALLAVALALWALQRARSRERKKQRQIQHLNRQVAERTEALSEANRMLLRSNDQLQLATRRDPLTLASNRRELQEWLDRECPLLIHDLAQAGSDRHCMLFCMIDIDNFKRINDGHGHQAGDQVLVEVAHRLRQVCREADILVRWGGEEFLLLVRDAHPQDIAQLAERIRAGVADRPVRLANGCELPVTCSIGVAPWPLSSHWPSLGDWEQSVSLADRALYAAKAAGKDAWVGVVAGPHAERSCLQALLAGALPDALPPGCIRVLHSTPAVPRLPEGIGAGPGTDP